MRMRRKTILGTSRYKSILTTYGVFIGAFVATVTASSIFAPINLSNAEQISIAVNQTGYFLDFTSTQNLAMEINATPGGAISAVKDTLNTRTNVPTGYKLYVSMANSDLNGNRMYLDGVSGSPQYIAPTSHTTSSPDALDVNSWGFAVPSDAEGASNNFATADKYTTPKPASGATFAAVPLEDAPFKIQEVSTPDETDGTDLDIYYAGKVNSSQAAGAYQTEITYSIISDDSIAGGDIATLSPATTEDLDGGETLTITTSLVTSDVNFGEITVKIGDSICANPTGSLDSSTSALVITCTSPAHSTGNYPATVWLAKYNKMYVISDAIEYSAKVWELQELTFMQNMTPARCASIATPTTGLGTAVSTADLIDTRDNKVYTVAKLKDGNCWMISPLRLGTYGHDLVLTPEDSNVQYDTIIPSGKIYNSSGTTWSNNAYSIFDRNNAIYGNWYNWYTATAGTGLPGMTASNATSSLCPKGWKLPNATGPDSYQNLITYVYGAGNQAQAQALPLSFVSAGYYSGADGKIYDGTSGTGHWSASASDSSSISAYDFFMTPSNTFLTLHGGYKVNGFSIRCVAER